MSEQTYIDSYINIINSSRTIIFDLINLLESEHYNESCNPVINNIINMINAQEIRLINQYNYIREQEPGRISRRQQNNSFNENADEITNYLNNVNRIRRNNLFRNMQIGRTIQPRDNDIVNILLSANNEQSHYNFLSPSQINISTEIIKYSELDDSIKENQTRCPISYHDFTDDTEIILIKHCKHIFKKQSLLNWFLQSKICPLCRYDLSTYTDVSGSNILNNHIQEQNNTPPSANSI